MVNISGNDLEQVPGLRKAAILMVMIGDEASGQILRELGVGHLPFLADLILISSFEIQRSQDCPVSLGQFGQAIVDSFPHFENVGLGTNKTFGNFNVLVADGLAVRAAPVFEDHVTADPIQESAELLGIANLLALAGANEAHDRFLNQIVHVRAAMTDVVEHLITEFQAQTLQSRAVEFQGGRLWMRC